VQWTMAMPQALTCVLQQAFASAVITERHQLLVTSRSLMWLAEPLCCCMQDDQQICSSREHVVHNASCNSLPARVTHELYV
jgi:hypothetical protein